ncbi:MAG: hypothetical protein ACFUZC_10835 [Chthoniobacteraceae bacterium]
MGQVKHIFVCSDWHLGGSSDALDGQGKIETPGSQICRSTKALTDFIDWIRSQANAVNEIELVINGDMVDFFAPDADYDPVCWLGDEDKAVKRLSEIADRTRGPDGRGPFEALRDLLAAGCALTILLGNHELELSLPKVRAALMERLDAAGRRFEFIFDGEACVRGHLIIEHGNRYDPFNVVDFSRLRQERSHLSRGLRCNEVERNDLFFLPPYGSELVTQVYNRLLPHVPFLNLLKPENEAAIPLVLALCPESRNILEDAIILFNLGKACVVNRLRTPAKPGRGGQLAAWNTGPYRSLDELLDGILGADAKHFHSEKRGRGNLSVGQGLREKLAKLVERGRELAGQVSIVEDIAKIFAAKTDGQRLQQVRVALRKVRDSVVFDPINDSGPYIEAAREIIKEGCFTAVVFGHTHLAKRIDVEGGTYFNCGTWADLLRLPPDIASDDVSKVDEAIAQFVNDMLARNIEPYLWRCLSYVEASVSADGAVTAELREFRASVTIP